MEQLRTIWVGNVPAHIDEFMLRSIFENVGPVTDIRIAGRKGMQTVYCFIEFAEPHQAQLALAMDGLTVAERQIRCSLAKKSQQPMGQQGQGSLPPPHAQQLPAMMPMMPQPVSLLQAQAQAQAQLLQMPALSMAMAASMSGMGGMPGLLRLPPGMQQSLQQPQRPVQRMDMGGMGMGAPSGPGPVSMLHGPKQPPPPVAPAPMIQPRRPHQDPDKVVRTVFVENVGDDADEQAIAEYFRACGEVLAVRLAGSAGQKKAWVEFGSRDASRSAREYDNTSLAGSTVRVRPSKTAIHTNGLLNRGSAPMRSPASPSGSQTRPAQGNESQQQQQASPVLRPASRNSRGSASRHQSPDGNREAASSSSQLQARQSGGVVHQSSRPNSTGPGSRQQQQQQHQQQHAMRGGGGGSPSAAAMMHHLQAAAAAQQQHQQQLALQAMLDPMTAARLAGHPALFLHEAAAAAAAGQPRPAHHLSAPGRPRHALTPPFEAMELPPHLLEAHLAPMYHLPHMMGAMGHPPTGRRSPLDSQRGPKRSYGGIQGRSLGDEKRMRLM